MTERQRRTAFAASAVILAAIVALIGVLDRTRSERIRRSPDRQPHRALIINGAAPTRPPTPPRPATPPGATTVNPRAKRTVIATAATFAEAFARYESGQLTTAVKRALQQSATPTFTAQLLAAPPTLPHGGRPPAPVSVLSVSPADQQPTRGAVVSVELRTNRTLSSLILQLSRGHGQWRVSGLG